MLGIARIADMGLVAAAALTAALALLGILALDISVVFGLLISPVAFMFSAGVLAYVTLRHGERSAMNLGMIAAAVAGIAGLTLVSGGGLVLVFAAICCASAVAIASVLRSTVSLKLAVLCIVPVAGFVGLLMHFFRADVHHYWAFSVRKSLSSLTAADLEQLGEHNLKVMFEDMPMLLTQSASIWAFFVVLCGVFVARYWQAQLSNEGGFQKEFHSLRFGKEAVAAFAAVFVLAQIFGGSFWASIASAMMYVFFIQGLSVLHCLTKQRGLNKSWLTGLYVMLFLPPTMLALSILGIADNFFQIRKI